jgi:hypothetical protein
LKFEIPPTSEREPNAQSRKIRKLNAVREAQGQHEGDVARTQGKPLWGQRSTATGKGACRQALTSASRSSQRLIAGAVLSACRRTTRRPILAGMAKPPPEPPTPPQLSSWDIYKVAAKAIWLGTVEAPDKAAAIEKATQEFKAAAWRLYAVGRR